MVNGINAMTALTSTLPPSRPSTPVKISWFEFLLNESLLQEHLQKDNPDPSATELVGLFLHQADLASASARELSKEQEPIGGDENHVGTEEKFVPEPKKAVALRLLALKVAAHFNWSLDILNREVPLAMICSILLGLLKVCMPPNAQGTKHIILDLASLPDQAIFALQLYHRWCIQTVIKNSLPVRIPKVMNVQVPGLLDPNIISAGAKDMVLKTVQDGLGDSIEILERILALQRALIIPTMHSFATVTENTDSVIHDWGRGRPISTQELRCQVCFDLGSVYFLQGNYPQAGAMFTETSRLMDELKEWSFCEVDKNQLKGYCSACNSLLVPVPSKMVSVGITGKIRECLKQDLPGLVQYLEDDNANQELSIEYRQALQEELFRHPFKSEELEHQVWLLNQVREIQGGSQASGSIIHSLYNKAAFLPASYIRSVFADALEKSKPHQKNNILGFLRYACEMSPDFNDTVKNLLGLLPPNQQEEINKNRKQDLEHTDLNLSYTTVHPNDLERQLLRSTEPKEIKNLITRLLKQKVHRQQIIHLSDKWRLPRDVHRTLESLPDSTLTTYAYILLAKAKIYTQLQAYNQARELYLAADLAVKDLSYKISRLIRWDVLTLDIVEYQQSHTLPDQQSLQDTIKKTKTCITSLQLDQDLQPGVDTLVSCCAFLFNVKDWEYLLHLGNTSSGCLQLSRLIASLCKELPQLKNARKPARELWDAMLLIFTSSQQQKRGNSGGTTNVMQRDSNMGLVSQAVFVQLLSKFREPVLLSAMISSLAKLYNILKDDASVEISSAYPSLWPTTVGSTAALNMTLVTTALNVVMKCAMDSGPKQPSWLRTRADIHFMHGQYAAALKNYLQAGVVVTDFFSEVPNRNIFDDQLYRKMIKCCTCLQCHTQVAVLCQFLDETDYITAFKSLQERPCHDAMDTYYDCIWDVAILEFLVNLHVKRGEMDKKQLVIRLMGQLELNTSNPPDILQRSCMVRKTKFLRAMAKEYL